MKRYYAAYLVLIGITCVQMAYYYPRLPETVASHFAASGTADSWMSKQAFGLVYLAALIVLSAIFCLITLLLPYMPDSLVNLPHKDYWLAPERRAETYLYIAKVMCVFGCSVIVFLIGVFQLAFQANLSPEQKLSKVFWVLLVSYLLFTFVWLVLFILRFRRRPA